MLKIVCLIEYKNEREDEYGVLQEEFLFNSPSYATAFVIGGCVHGLTECKTDEGKTLKEIEQEDQ